MTTRWTATVDSNVRVDLVRDEVLVETSSITLDVPLEVPIEHLARCVGVPGVDGSVERVDAGRYRWRALDRLPPGRHLFVIEALTDAANIRLSERLAVPFHVVLTRGRIPDELRVSSFVRVRRNDTGFERLDSHRWAEGDYLEVLKATRRDTDELIWLGFDEQGDAIDAEGLLREHDRRLAERRGKMHPTLAARFSSLDAGGTVLVDAWFEPEEAEPSLRDRVLDEKDVPAATQRAERERAKWQTQGEAIIAALGAGMEIVDIGPLAPVMTLRLTGSELARLVEAPEITYVFLQAEEWTEDIGASVAIASSEAAHAAGRTGEGVRVAVWELEPAHRANLAIDGRFRDPPAPGAQTSKHSQNVHAIIRHRAGHEMVGHAPRCLLFSANENSRDALRWAVDSQRCSVVNQSVHDAEEARSGALSRHDVYKDWIALHLPFPLIVHAAGNYFALDSDGIHPPSSEFVNHKGYNTISVGNHSDDGMAMDTMSVFRNPITPHGDRELPEICANGTGVTADGLTYTGTSQAAPAVAAVAALMHGTSPILVRLPEACRAVLFASAVRKLPGSAAWWQDVLAGVDSAQGAGALNAAEACEVAANRSLAGAAATQRGWDTGLLTASSFDAVGQASFTYRALVPKVGPRNLKVALAWSLSIPAGGDLRRWVDLDLEVFDPAGARVGYSGSFDNSYEIAELTGEPGVAYTIRIRRASGTVPTYFGIAWTVHP